MAKVTITHRKNEMCVTTLGEGDLAEILSWGSFTDHRGLVVLRCGSLVVALGTANLYWLNVFTRENTYDDCFVRVLEPDEIVELQNEEHDRG